MSRAMAHRKTESPRSALLAAPRSLKQLLGTICLYSFQDGLTASRLENVLFVFGCETEI